jgi:acyl carrier protein
MQELSSIRNNLLYFLQDRLGSPSDLDENTDLIDSGLIDSLMLTDLVLHIQAEFGVALQTGDVTPRNFRNVGSLGRLILERQTQPRRKAA